MSAADAERGGLAGEEALRAAAAREERRRHFEAALDALQRLAGGGRRPRT